MTPDIRTLGEYGSHFGGCGQCMYEDEQPSLANAYIDQWCRARLITRHAVVQSLLGAKTNSENAGLRMARQGGGGQAKVWGLRPLANAFMTMSRYVWQYLRSSGVLRPHHILTCAGSISP